MLICKKKELDEALKGHYSEDDPRFGTFYNFALFINRRAKEERYQLRCNQRKKIMPRLWKGGEIISIVSCRKKRIR